MSSEFTELTQIGVNNSQQLAESLTILASGFFAGLGLNLLGRGISNALSSVNKDNILESYYSVKERVVNKRKPTGLMKPGFDTFFILFTGAAVTTGGILLKNLELTRTGVGIAMGAAGNYAGWYVGR